MNRISEELKSVVALAPVSQEAGGNTTSDYVDGAEMREIDFIVSFGAVAATKTVKVEVLAATDAEGSDAAEIGEIVFTSPTGGVTEGDIHATVEVNGDRGRYYAVKITNTDTNAVVIAALAMCRPTYMPAANANVLNI